MNIPYGMASFYQIRVGAYHYVDKTPYLPRLEDKVLGRRYLMFLRPRRSGKSLWLSVLEHYYDLNKADLFDQLFGDLYIGQHPTPEKNAYLIFRLEFTGINPASSLEQMTREVMQLLQTAVEKFCRANGHRVTALNAFSARLVAFDTPSRLMTALLAVLEGSGHSLYVLVDEYDNFTNALISMGRHELYMAITHESGFLREFYKALKEGTSTGVISRIFLTGVSPVTMDDVTSGANMFKQVSLDADLNAMAGFTHAEVRAMLLQHMQDIGMTLDPDTVMADLIGLYNGYRFSPETDERVFNPDMILYFLSSLRPPEAYPRVLIDHNVRMDVSRLRSMLFERGTSPRPYAIQTVRTILETGAITGQVKPTFPLDSAFREEFFVSLLYYLGLLSLPPAGENSQGLVVPNYVARTLYWESFNTILMEQAQVSISSELERTLLSLAKSGDILPFLEYAFPLILKMLSNRDLIQMTEKNVKFLFLPLIMTTNVFLPWSEVELNHGYSDLLLIPSTAMNYPIYSFILEFKYVKTSQETRRIDREGVEHVKVRTLSKAERTRAVEKSFVDGFEQIARYKADPRLMRMGSPLGWKSFTLVFDGLDSLHIRSPEGLKRKLLSTGPLPPEIVG